LRFQPKSTITFSDKNFPSNQASGNPNIETQIRFTPAYAARNASPRLLEASACGHAGVGGPIRHGRLSSSCGHEIHAGVCVFAL